MLRRSKLLILLCLAWSECLASSLVDTMDMTNKIKCLDMSPKYRKRADNLVEVEVDVTIISISSLNLAKMELNLDLHLSQTWTDKRCMFRLLPCQEKVVTLQGYGLQHRLEHLWIPDTYITNAVSTTQHHAPQPQQSTKVHFSGEIQHRVRLSLTASCPMNLQFFPFDQQKCILSWQSYSFPNSKVHYKWANNSTLKFQEGEAYQESMMPEVKLRGFRKTSRVVLDDKEEKSRIDLILYFDRPLGYYLFEIYTPAVFIVIMSWFNFWLNRAATPARITLGVTTVLTITTLKANADSNLPHTSYPKAIGLYLWVCFVFTFAALIEFSAAAYLEKRRNFLQSKVQPSTEVELGVQAERDSALTENARSLLLPIEKDDIKETSDTEVRTRKKSYMSKKMNDPKLIEILKPSIADMYSRILFPAVFLAFNVVYWGFFLLYSTMQQEL